MGKPKHKTFVDIARQCRGNITKIAGVFGVNRTTIYLWANKDPRFRATLDDCRGELLDECVNVGRVVALGIPDIDDAGKLIGWKERPDPSMLRYFMSTLGRKEGYGDDPPEKDNIDALQKVEPPVIVFEK